MQVHYFEVDSYGNLLFTGMANNGEFTDSSVEKSFIALIDQRGLFYWQQVVYN